MDAFEKRLLDEFQRDFPLVRRPYAAVAKRLGRSEAEVIATFRRLEQTGVVSRIGAVLRPDAVGASTLAAMAVPEHRFDDVADFVNGFEEVNHNYEREHRFNLWFVIAAAASERVRAVIEEIETATGLPVLDLPMLEAYHLDLGFPLQWS